MSGWGGGGGGGGGSTTFIGLTDVPASFTAAGDRIVAVNAGATALEFVNTLPYIRETWTADQLLTPNNADWIINANAGVLADTTNAGINVARFDDTTEEGKGFIAFMPLKTALLKLSFKSKAQVAPPAARTVGLKIYYRRLQDNTAVSGTWAGASDGSKVLTDVDIPANLFLQDDSQELSYTPNFSPAIVAGNWYLFELTRINPAGGTELVDDWDLAALMVERYAA
jgi:hypothetical protein